MTRPVRLSVARRRTLPVDLEAGRLFREQLVRERDAPAPGRLPADHRPARLADLRARARPMGDPEPRGLAWDVVAVWVGGALAGGYGSWLVLKAALNVAASVASAGMAW